MKYASGNHEKCYIYLGILKIFRNKSPINNAKSKAKKAKSIKIDMKLCNKLKKAYTTT